ncbi:DUF350 domain-containing protein [Rhodobacteraceae bacterium R_SAG6]|uniref:DUF350 domain-containing protein n=1 Tax=Tritonibacter mobilis TaxID=379347 RepID=UPI0014468EED|nr:DUF350 domain-containing protein [Rhodobacteraceae bacterium G21628-S1]NKX28822.1 DUF350 domain-containing protein [Rhodobacteraceae bacterium R_SAG6]
MDYFSAINLTEIISTIFYTFLGAGLMFVIWKIMDRVTPFHLLEQVEKEQNLALAVLIGMVYLSLAIIIAAVILS